MYVSQIKLVTQWEILEIKALTLIRYHEHCQGPVGTYNFGLPGKWPLEFCRIGSILNSKFWYWKVGANKILLNLIFGKLLNKFYYRNINLQNFTIHSNVCCSISFHSHLNSMKIEFSLSTAEFNPLNLNQFWYKQNLFLCFNWFRSKLNDLVIPPSLVDVLFMFVPCPTFIWLEFFLNFSESSFFLLRDLMENLSKILEILFCTVTTVNAEYFSLFQQLLFIKKTPF